MEMEVCQRPQSRAELFIAFTVLALQGFGGAQAFVQRELVEKKRWLTKEDFLGEWAVAQVMPGPNVVNLSLIVGGRFFGIPGALAALGGLMTVPLMLVLTLAFIYAGYSNHPEVAGAIRGISAVTAGIIAATGLKLLGGLKNNVLGIALCGVLGASCFVAIALLRLPLGYTLLGLGAISFAIVFRRLAP
jgi:chromate transporter